MKKAIREQIEQAQQRTSDIGVWQAWRGEVPAGRAPLSTLPYTPVAEAAYSLPHILGPLHLEPRRKSRKGKPLREIRDGMLKCGECGEWKSLTEYYTHQRRDRTGKHFASYCDPCRKQRCVRRNHALTKKQYDTMLAQAAGRCAICERELRKPHLDHDHTTGQLRGVLCSRCNTSIGIFEESPELLRRAAEYIEYWAAENALVKPTPADRERERLMREIRERVARI